MSVLAIQDGQPYPVGIHPGVPMSEYLAIDAMGASRLGTLAISPKHYQHLLGEPRWETAALSLGTAVHMAALQPELFEAAYVMEPSVEGYDKPRATKAYKEAVAALEAGGRTVLKRDVLAKVRAMAAAIHAHPVAAKLLARCPERELTMLWENEGRACRGRVDFLGNGAAGDLKTTRNLALFSPHVVTKLGYYRDAAWYRDGLRRLGRDVSLWFFIAIDSAAPYDVGVYELVPDALGFGEMHYEVLLTRLAECEASGEWPGMFPAIQMATITDAVANAMIAEEEVA